MGDPTLGIITTHHYSAAHEGPENAAFKKAYAEANGNGSRPNFMAVAGYDGAAAIYQGARKLGGKLDADKAMTVLEGLKPQSPPGPIHIDAGKRDSTQSGYVRHG